MKISVHIEEWELTQPFRISGFEWIKSRGIVVQLAEQAAGSFERALAETGQMHFRAWYNLGVARMNMGEGEAACDAVERALQINPNYEAAAAFRRARCERGE